MKKIKAFTLLETIVVIIVFCIWILAVLHWLSQTLRNKDYANIQIKSAFLAREWIELMFNLRDANYSKNLDWNCIFNRVIVGDESFWMDSNPFCTEYFWSWSANVLKVGIWSWDNYVFIETWVIEDTFDKNFDEYQIYFHNTWYFNDETWFVYNHTWADEEKTWFARYIVLTWVISNDTSITRKDLLKIESHVLYKKWALTWEKVMETFIGNYYFKQ